MIKTSKFTLDPGEQEPICTSCKQVIVDTLTEISTQRGLFS